LNCVNLI